MSNPPFEDYPFVKNFVKRIDDTFIKLNKDVGKEELLKYITERRNRLLDNFKVLPVSKTYVKQDKINKIIELSSVSNKRPYLSSYILTKIYNKTDDVNKSEVYRPYIRPSLVLLMIRKKQVRDGREQNERLDYEVYESVETTKDFEDDYTLKR